MALENEITRVAGGTKDTLKALITKLGGTVGDELIDQYPVLANGATKPDKWDKGILLDGGTLKDVDGNDISADVKSALDLGAYQFSINDDGDLILTYIGDRAPNYSINEDGDLIMTSESGGTINLGHVRGEGGDGIDVTGAKVGQTIKVKAVDTDGKPTAWEAVDMAGGETEVIALSEDVNAVTFDLKGCDSFAIVLDAPPVDTEMNYVLPTFNSIVGSFITLNFASKADRRISVLQINKIVDGLWFFSFKPGNAVALQNATLSKVGDIFVLNNTIPMDITSMGLNAYTGQRFPKGTKIYVVRGETVV